MILLRVSFRQLVTLIMFYDIVACVVQTADYIDYVLLLRVPFRQLVTMIMFYCCVCRSDS